jgi:hypothetical protein
MKTNKNFIERLNGVNFGKRALLLSIIAACISLLVKVFVVPFIQHKYNNSFFIALKFWINLIENIAILNVLLFFVCLIFFKAKIGNKILYYMQSRDTTYNKDKWIGTWLNSIIISIIIIGITTYVYYTLFKNWWQYLFFLLLLCLPFVIKNKLQIFKK